MSALELGALQTGLLALIKDRPTALTDPYLSNVARSRALVLVREIAASWRAISLERHAPLTSAALQQRGGFGNELMMLINAPDLGPFHADVRNAFWSSAAQHDDPIVRAVARLEQALAGVADSTLDSGLIIEWPVDPYPVLAALIAGSPIPTTPPAPHRVIVNASDTHRFRVVAADVEARHDRPPT